MSPSGGRLPVSQETPIGPLLSSCPVCLGRLRTIGLAPYRTKSESEGVPVLSCEACDLLFRIPPLAMQRRHFERAGYARDRNRDALWERKKRFFEFVIDLIERRSQGEASTLLDVGAGFGHLLSVAKQRGWGVAGVEVVPGLRLRVVKHLGVACWAELQEVEGRFDVVTFTDSFYYFEQPAQALLLASDHLAPQGLLVLRLTNRNWLIRVGRRLHLKRAYVPMGDVFVSWSLKGIRRLLARHGFAVEEVRFYERGWRRPRGLRAAYGLLAAVSRLTYRWGWVPAPGMLVVARKVEGSGRGQA